MHLNSGKIVREVDRQESDNALCNECLQCIPFKVMKRDGKVYLEKVCSLHGKQETLLSTEEDYFVRARSQPLAQTNFIADTEVVLGCPYDCGLCKSHEQDPCMIIIEALDECNLHCPTCIAGSKPGAGRIRSCEDILSRVGTISRRTGLLDLIMISGGEPTIHPEIIQILQGVKQHARHVMLITNGTRISEDEKFVQSLAEIRGGIEIYLQFDSLREEVLNELRGGNYREVRLQALEKLQRYDIPVTLVCVVKNGLNEDEVAEIVKDAICYPNVRGVTFQPIRASGRHTTFNHHHHSITLSEIRRRLIDNLALSEDALVPHPCNPENICIGYFLRENGGGNLIEATTKIFSPDNPARERINQLMYFIPELNSPSLRYDELFRIAIVSFLDKYNFTTNQARRSGIVFLTDDGLLAPLDVYYLIGAKGQTRANGDTNNVITMA